MKIRTYKLKFESVQTIEIKEAGSAVSMDCDHNGINLNVLEVGDSRLHKIRVHILKSDDTVPDGCVFVGSFRWGFIPYHLFTLKVG